MLSQLDVVPETQPISIQQVPGISGAEGSHQQSGKLFVSKGTSQLEDSTAAIHVSIR